MAIWNKAKQKFLDNNKTLFEGFILSDKDGNPINSFGVASNIPIAAGDVTGYSHINKFGFNPAVGTGFEAVTNSSNVFTYVSSADTITVSSNSTSDDGLDIEIQGLDANYNLQSETVTLDSNETFTTTNTYIRFFRAIVQSTNVGVITIKIGTTTINTIGAGEGQTLMAVYTVPAGKTAYFIKFQGSVEKNTGTIFRIMARKFGGSFNIKGQFGSFGTPVTYDYPVPLIFTEKSDIEINVKAQGTTGAGAIFDLLLVDNV